MRPSQAYEYIAKSKRRRRIVETLNQPSTATQLSRRTGLRADACRHVIGELARCGLLECKNAAARRSRLYGLTVIGLRSRNKLFPGSARATNPDVDWDTLGWLCYRHRSAVLLTLVEPMQPAAIKRKARSRDPSLRISANNVRDVIRLFLKRGIVQPVRIRKKAHLRYKLSETGNALRESLLRAKEVA